MPSAEVGPDHKHALWGALAQVGFPISECRPLSALHRVCPSQTHAFSAYTAAEAALEREIAPIDDIRSTARYRRRVARALLREALRL